MLTSRETGKQAETVARVYLQQQGLTLVAENYSCRAGEIDLIMSDNQHLIFIEVKFRRHLQYGSGLDRVTPKKQSNIIQAARHYLHQQGLTETACCRFDVISLTPDKSEKKRGLFASLGNNNPFAINWIQHAFY